MEKTLEQTIALLVRELDSTFERVKAGGLADPALLLETLGSSATVVHIDPEGEVATEGAPLLYHARLPADDILRTRSPRTRTWRRSAARRPRDFRLNSWPGANVPRF